MTYMRSPVSDGGRGLKQLAARRYLASAQFARQRWRAWIETFWPWSCRC